MGLTEDFKKVQEQKEEVLKSFFGSESTTQLANRISELKKGKRAAIGEVRKYGGVDYIKVTSTGNPSKDWVRFKPGHQSPATPQPESKVEETGGPRTIESVTNTKLERDVLSSLINSLYAEPGFSDVDVKDIAELTGLSSKVVRGVLSSLVQKGIITVDGGKDFTGLIYLNKDFYDIHPEWSKEMQPQPEAKAPEKVFKHLSGSDHFTNTLPAKDGYIGKTETGKQAVERVMQKHDNGQYGLSISTDNGEKRFLVIKSDSGLDIQSVDKKTYDKLTGIDSKTAGQNMGAGGIRDVVTSSKRFYSDKHLEDLVKRSSVDERHFEQMPDSELQHLHDFANANLFNSGLNDITKKRVKEWWTASLTEIGRRRMQGRYDMMKERGDLLLRQSEIEDSLMQMGHYSVSPDRDEINKLKKERKEILEKLKAFPAPTPNIEFHRGDPVKYRGQNDKIVMIHPNGQVLLESGASVHKSQLVINALKQSKQ